MSIAPGYTNDQIREIVYAYDQQPHGTKATWREQRGISATRLRTWRNAVYDGDLDMGLIPRKDSGVTSTPRYRKHIAHSHDAKARRIAELEQRIGDLEKSNDTLQKSNDALGKAIGLLHEVSAQEPDDGQDTTTHYDS